LKVVQITGAKGEVLEAEWLKRAETVHRQLRPQIPPDYKAKMLKIFAQGGEMCICVEGDAVLAVAVYRSFDNTYAGHRFYVDDLVTDETQRSRGAGHMLMQYLEAESKRRGSTWIELESGVQREQAHKFYFREGMTISGYSFRKPLK
jgi:GNAT superfamily N-acetyltransferase